MSEWISCVVEDIAAPTRNALVGGPFGSNLVSNDYTEFGVPVIRGQNMGFGRWVSGEFAFVSEEKAQELSANIARPGDIVFTQRGTLGQVAIVPRDSYSRYVVSQSQMKLTVDPQKADTLYLYYYFTSPEQQAHIRQNSIQTGVPHTNLTILRDTPVVLPPLAEQREIARILGALDDKIELNRQMNATLEATARAIFKSWFVDFDPVHAKANGEQPVGMDAETATLFPNSFEESALGLIPAGWGVSTIGEEVSVVGGSTPTHQRTPSIGTKEQSFGQPPKIREFRSRLFDQPHDNRRRLNTNQFRSAASWNCTSVVKSACGLSGDCSYPTCDQSGLHCDGLPEAVAELLRAAMGRSKPGQYQRARKRYYLHGGKQVELSDHLSFLYRLMKFFASLFGQSNHYS